MKFARVEFNYPTFILKKKKKKTMPSTVLFITSGNNYPTIKTFPFKTAFINSE